MEEEATARGAEILYLALPADGVAAKRLLQKKGWAKRTGQNANARRGVLPRSAANEEAWTFGLSAHPSLPAYVMGRPSSVA
jgi:hypothetical protein